MFKDGPPCNPNDRGHAHSAGVRHLNGRAPRPMHRDSVRSVGSSETNTYGWPCRQEGIGSWHRSRICAKETHKGTPPVMATQSAPCHTACACLGDERGAPESNRALDPTSHLRAQREAAGLTKRTAYNPPRRCGAEDQTVSRQRGLDYQDDDRRLRPEKRAGKGCCPPGRSPLSCVLTTAHQFLCGTSGGHR